MLFPGKAQDWRMNKKHWLKYLMLLLLWTRIWGCLLKAVDLGSALDWITKWLSLPHSCCPSQNSVELKRSRPSAAHIWQQQVWALCPARSMPRYRHVSHTGHMLVSAPPIGHPWSQKSHAMTMNYSVWICKSRWLRSYEKRWKFWRLLRICPLNFFWWTGREKSNQSSS